MSTRRIEAARVFAVLILLSVAPARPAVGQNTDVPVLRDGIAIVGDLDGGEHFLAAVLKQGQTLQLDVREERVNVSVALIKVDGEQLVRLSNFGSGYDRETLTYVAEQTGTYVIIVGTRTPPSKGRYVLQTRIKETTAADGERVRAERLLEEGLAKSKGSPADLREAVAKLGDSLLSWQKVGEPYWEGYTLYNLGRVHDNSKDSAKALDYYNQALPRIKQAQDIHGEGVTLNGIGLIYSRLGDRAKTLDYYSRALTLVRQVGSAEEEATGLHNLAAVHSDLGEEAKALDYYEQALSRFRQLNNRLGEANSLLGLGEVHSDLGAQKKAIDYFGQAAAAFKAVGELRGAATAQQDIGDEYLDLNDPAKALEYYSQALGIFTALKNQRDVANALRAMGWAHSALGEKAAALDHFHKALSLLKEVGDLRIEGSVLNAIGTFYNGLGETAKSLDYFKEALPRFRQTKERKEEAETLLNIGITYTRLHRHEEAIVYLKQSLSLFKSLGNKNREANILILIGGTYSNWGDKATAAGYIKEGLTVFEGILGDSNSVADFNNIGYIYFETGEKQKALNYLNRSLAYSKYDPAVRADAFPLGVLSRWWESFGNRRLAIFYGKLSVNRYQEKRGDLQGIDSDFQKSFFRDNQGGYRQLAHLFLEAGELEQAVQVLNLYQDQKYFDFNRDVNSTNKDVDLSPRERAFAARYESATERVGQVGARIEALKQQTFGRHPNEQEAAQLRALDGDLKRATDAFLDVIKDAEVEFTKPPGADDKIKNIRDVADMQSALRELSLATKQKTAALYTLIDNDRLYIILLTPDGDVKSFASEIKAGELNKKVLEFYALLQSPTYDPRPLGHDLYKLIFKPVESALKKSGAQTLMWQLDGSLRYVPMAALFDGEQYLVERYQNVVFTRTNAGRTPPAVRSGWTGTGFGSSREYTVDLLGDGNKILFPSLPDVIQELQSIFRTGAEDSGIISGAVFMDQQFTKNAFYEAMKQHRPLVHIASHFAFRPGEDSRSFLVLGDGAALTISEMKKREKLFEGVELLTLSACNTAATQPDANGKEIDGFAELAQRLGARAVMATLWQVSDNSTPWLMKSFYSELQTQPGMTKATALRNAQLALLKGAAGTKPLSGAMKNSTASAFKLEIVPNGLIKSPPNIRAEIIYVEAKNAPLFKPDERRPFANPYFWAPFVLYGDGR